jgi:hypothetical protein
MNNKKIAQELMKLSKRIEGVSFSKGLIDDLRSLPDLQSMADRTQDLFEQLYDEARNYESKSMQDAVKSIAKEVENAASKMELSVNYLIDDLESDLSFEIKQDFREQIADHLGVNLREITAVDFNSDDIDRDVSFEYQGTYYDANFKNGELKSVDM